MKTGATPPPPVVGSIEEAAADFIAHKMKMGAWSASSKLRALLDLGQFASVRPGGKVARVDEEWMAAYLEQMAHQGGRTGAGLALASQKTRFAMVKEFLGWCVRRKKLKHSPAADLERDDKRWCGKRAARLMGRGKPQLRGADEVLAFLTATSKLALVTERVALGVTLLCGLRSGELLHLRAGAVDWTGAKLWVRGEGGDWNTKTAASEDAVDLPTGPAWLLADLRTLVESRKADAYLFPSNREPGEPWGDDWLNRRVHKTCKAAGVRDICAHGLRDTCGTLVVALGKGQAFDVARLLRQADKGETARKHYIGQAPTRPALSLVSGSRQ